jgi:predicted transposase YdaD
MGCIILNTTTRGRAEGVYQEKIEAARRMKQDGLEPERIAAYTRLSPEEVGRL